jgi:DHA2 family multidrug resistance protein
VAYANLKPGDAQQASGLINLSRQLGGSFGIAILATYVTVHTQMHRVDLVTNIYPGNPLVDERVRGLTANLLAHGYDPVSAQRGALAILNQETMRQAAMLSYNDAWMLLLLTFVCVAPAILLLRKPRGGSAMPEGAH